MNLAAHTSRTLDRLIFTLGLDVEEMSEVRLPSTSSNQSTQSELCGLQSTPSQRLAMTRTGANMTRPRMRVLVPRGAGTSGTRTRTTTGR